MKCLICDKIPRLKDSKYCSSCAHLVEKYKKQHEKEKRIPQQFVVYRHYVVGMFRKDNGKLYPELVNQAIDSLPESRTINLNKYIEGMDRRQVKKLKGMVLRTAESHINPMKLES